VERVPGLSELFLKKTDIESAVRVSEIPSLFVLPAGSPLAEPLSLLASTGYADVMQALRRLFRFIVLDGPPGLGFTDTALIAPRAGGVVLVVAAGERRRGAGDQADPRWRGGQAPRHRAIRHAKGRRAAERPRQIGRHLTCSRSA
jgi:hypothetical protein